MPSRESATSKQQRELKKHHEEQMLSWESFCYSILGGFMFEPEDRPKTHLAMHAFWKRCPRRYLLKLLTETSVIVFAPSPHERGSVSPAPRGPDDETQMIYLSPELERLAQWRVNVTVAHELAHAILKHGTAENLCRGLDKSDLAAMKRHGPGRMRAERQADALIKKWGYAAAYWILLRFIELWCFRSYKIIYSRSRNSFIAGFPNSIQSEIQFLRNYSGQCVREEIVTQAPN